MIHIHSGDIFEIKAQALVVPGNKQADLSWSSHICDRVRKLANESVFKERNAIGDIDLGGVCWTGGDGTGFENLIHAAILDKYDFNPLFLLKLRQRTSDRTLRSCLAGIKRLVEEKAVKSLAVSAMGAGIGGMNYRKCVKMIFEELNKCKCDIHFAAYKARHVRIAEEELKSL